MVRELFSPGGYYDDEEDGAAPAPPRAAAAVSPPRKRERVFSRGAHEGETESSGPDSPQTQFDRAGVSRVGRGGRVVAAHLSTANLYNGSDRETPRSGSGRRSSPSPDAGEADDAVVVTTVGDLGVDASEAKGAGDGGDAEEEEDAAVLRARMRARLKKGKRRRKKKGGRRGRTTLQVHTEETETKEDVGTSADGGGKTQHDDDDGHEAKTAGTNATAQGVQADKDFVEADWDDDNVDEAEAKMVAAEARRKAGVGNPGVQADDDFADADWDDEDSDDAAGQQEHLARPRADPGVTADAVREGGCVGRLLRDCVVVVRSHESCCG